MAFPITRKKILEAFEVTRRSCKQDRNGSWGIDNLEHLRSNNAQVVISNKRSKKNSGINEFFIIFLVTTNNKSQANLNTNIMSTIKGTHSNTLTTVITAAGNSSKFSQAN